MNDVKQALDAIVFALGSRPRARLPVFIRVQKIRWHVYEQEY